MSVAKRRVSIKDHGYCAINLSITAFKHITTSVCSQANGWKLQLKTKSLKKNKKIKKKKIQKKKTNKKINFYKSRWIIITKKKKKEEKKWNEIKKWNEMKWAGNSSIRWWFFHFFFLFFF